MFLFDSPCLQGTWKLMYAYSVLFKNIFSFKQKVKEPKRSIIALWNIYSAVLGVQQSISKDMVLFILAAMQHFWHPTSSLSLSHISRTKQGVVLSFEGLLWIFSDCSFIQRNCREKAIISENKGWKKIAKNKYYVKKQSMWKFIWTVKQYFDWNTPLSLSVFICLLHWPAARPEQRVFSSCPMKSILLTTFPFRKDKLELKIGI